VAASLAAGASPASLPPAGLYGNACPATTANLLAAVRSGALAGTVVSRISPGEYIQLGRQGSRRLGEVEGVDGLQVGAGGGV
jgi:peptidyl-prolyl cis-trans isomerase B (cyclophilin B)